MEKYRYHMESTNSLGSRLAGKYAVHALSSARVLKIISAERDWERQTKSVAC